MKPIQLMIVGVQKAGTSSLLRYLAQHPDIATHAQPEMPFFLQDREYTRGYAWAFDKYFASALSTSSVPGTGLQTAPTGERECRLIAKNVMVIHSQEIMQRIYEHNPALHLVILLREPVARAYSAYWWARRRGWETLKTFEEALAAEETRITQEGWFKWRQCAYRHNSTYYPHVKNVLELFGSERVHIILTETLKDNARAVCQGLFHHIGVTTDFAPVIGQRHNTGSTMPRSEKFGFLFTQFMASHNPLRRAIRRLVPDATAYKLRKAVMNWNEKSWTPPPIAPATQAELAAYFKPFNQELAALLGRELW